MALETVVFVCGAVFLVIAIVGGGLEIKELRVPKVKWGARVIFATLGIMLILVGLGLKSREPDHPKADQPTVARDPVSVPPADQPVTIQVYDQLGPHQISEQVVLRIEDRTVGTLTVDAVHPEAMLTVTLPSRGPYSYTAESEAVLEEDGQYRRARAAGQGSFRAENGKQLDVLVSNTGTSSFISLVDAQEPRH